MLGIFASLIEDTLASWARMFAALFISIAIALYVGIYSALSKRAERILIPVVDIFQTLPILTFFPFAIFIIIAMLPGPIGVNAAVIFLIITSMVWNIIFAVYESVKTLPKEFVEIADLYHMTAWERTKKIFIPASLPRVVEQSILSWSIGLFYLVTSEIFSAGRSNYSVKYGIGVALTRLAFSTSPGHMLYYLLGIGVFIAFVIATRMLFFLPLENRVTRYNRAAQPVAHQDPFSMLRPVKIAAIFRRFAEISNFRVLNEGIAAANSRAVRNIRAIGRRGMQIGIKPPGRWQRKLLYALALLAALYYAYLAGLLAVVAKYELLVLESLAATFARVWFTYFVILAIGLPLCVYLVFMSGNAKKYLLLFQIMASIPATILLPMIIVSLEKYPMHAELVAFSVLFLSGIWYIVFSIVASSRNLPAGVLEVKRIFNVKEGDAWKDIYLKALIPGILTGSVTGIAAEWNATIVAEYFTTTGISGSTVVTGVNIGMGKLLDLSLSSGNLALMGLALLNFAAMVLIINTLLWRRLYNAISRIYT